MTNILPQPAATAAASAPERTATPAERANEAARLLACKYGTRPGYSCDGNGNMHLGRYATARHLGYLTAEQMTEVPGGVFTALTLVSLPSDSAR